VVTSMQYNACAPHTQAHVNIGDDKEEEEAMPYLKLGQDSNIKQLYK